MLTVTRFHQIMIGNRGKVMRLIFFSAFLALTSCGDTTSNLWTDEFYLNCSDANGEIQKVFRINEERKEIAELEDDGQLYLVCDGCETLVSESTIKWAEPVAEGGERISTIDRRSGKYSWLYSNPDRPPVNIGGVLVPADLLGGTIEYACERSSTPPDAKF